MSTSNLELNQVITTHSSEKQPIIKSSTPTTWIPIDPAKTLFQAQIYSTHTFPVNLTEESDTKLHEEYINSGPAGIGIPNGVQIVYNKFSPGAFCPIHRTETIDFGVVVEGELELLFDDDRKQLLKKGDVIVQRGTYHGWRNPSDVNETIIFFVALAAQKIKIGDEVLEQDLSAFGM